MTMPSIDPLATLRVLCGIWFLPHCIGKIRNVEAAASNTFQKAALWRPRTLVIVTILFELMAATGLIFGIFEKTAAALAVVVLGGASFAVVKINGFNWRWQKLGPEYMIFWAIACILSVWR
jgi:putative oxidoreductase